MYGSLVFKGLLVLHISALIVFAGSEEDDSADKNDLSNGLGDHINWHTLEDGLALSKVEKKPLMLIIHKSWCGACKSLKPKFRESKEVAEKSSAFVMVNTMDQDEPDGEIYQPDGGYIPRILFFDPEGKFLANVINEDGNPKYKYYYFNEVGIVKSMEKVISSMSEKDNVKTTGDVNSTTNSNATQGQQKFEL